MKSLTFKLVIPLTIISFVTITKWWFVEIVDAPNEILTGFPLPFVCRAWHTSMALQFFVVAFFGDLLFYFLCCFGFVLLVDKYVIQIRPYKIITILLWLSAIIVIFITSIIIANGDNVFYLIKPFNTQTQSSGIRLIWDVF